MDLESGKKTVGRPVRLLTGWSLTIAGLLLGPVPVVPGFVLLLPGLALLCSESRWMRALLRRHREKRLLRRAMREAERVGIKIDLERDEEADGRGGPPAR